MLLFFPGITFGVKALDFAAAAIATVLHAHVNGNTIRRFWSLRRSGVLGPNILSGATVLDSPTKLDPGLVSAIGLSVGTAVAITALLRADLDDRAVWWRIWYGTPAYFVGSPRQYAPRVP